MVASFGSDDALKAWTSVNDGVMGGVSKGGFKRSGEGTLLFSGELSLANNGGFASIRMKQSELGLEGTFGIIVKAKGDGRTYWLDLRAADQMGGTSYRAYLPTTAGEWKETRVPFEDFKLQAFGRERIIHVIDEVLVSAKAETGPLKASELIDLAIERGVPIFNNGDVAGCAGIYEITGEALLGMENVPEESRKGLIKALKEARAETSARQRAWILRGAIDTTRASLK